MGQLYETGWRQGSIFEAELELGCVILGGGGPCVQTVPHTRWLVATQDCDLAAVDEQDTEPTVELRPVYAEGAPNDWGIRSASLLLTESPPEYLRSHSPRLHVSPAVLTHLAEGGARPVMLDEGRRIAVKTWLGLRYDRPAVPDEFVPLAKRIGTEVKRRRRQEVGERVRDILMQFDDDHPPRFSLFAILADNSNESQVREWLAEVAQSIPAALGVPDQIEAAAAGQISLQLVETSYAADVTQLTWRGEDPSGAM